MKSSIKEYLPSPRYNNEKMVPCCVRVPKKLLQDSKKIACDQGLTFTTVIESLLTYFVDEMNSKKSA